MNILFSRREAMKRFGLGASAVAASASLLSAPVLLGEEAEASERRGRMAISDIDILNFALNLEYLEAEFYAYTVGGSGLSEEYFSGKGKQGQTTGGTKTSFSDSTLQTVATNIASDEFEHVVYLRKALGKAAIAKPEIRLDPLGSTQSEKAFLIYSRAFEDTGVSAYGGAAKLIKSPAILGVAARILATEAYHAGNIRLFMIQKGITVDALDTKDVPPTASRAFATDSQALAIVRNVKEVLKIVAPFFPNGLNGKIK
jgi:hypothetical protein